MSEQPQWTTGAIQVVHENSDVSSAEWFDLYDAQGSVIGRSYSPGDAALWAAAPDLYAALMALRDDKIIQAVCPSPLWGAMVDAILKARGEA